MPPFICTLKSRQGHPLFHRLKLGLGLQCFWWPLPVLFIHSSDNALTPASAAQLHEGCREVSPAVLHGQVLTE